MWSPKPTSARRTSEGQLKEWPAASLDPAPDAWSWGGEGGSSLASVRAGIKLHSQKEGHSREVSWTQVYLVWPFAAPHRLYLLHTLCWLVGPPPLSHATVPMYEPVQKFFQIETELLHSYAAVLNMKLMGVTKMLLYLKMSKQLSSLVRTSHQAKPWLSTKVGSSRGGLGAVQPVLLHWPPTLEGATGLGN